MGEIHHELVRQRLQVAQAGDDRDLAEALGEALRDAGYSVVSAPQGAAALEALRGSNPLPDLILLDLMMPVMDGHEFVAELRKDPRLSPIPVVLLTADGRVHQEVVALKAVAGLRKPVRFEVLIAMVAKFCPPL